MHQLEQQFHTFPHIVTDGRIYAVEFSPTTAKKLVRLARQRTNIALILGEVNQIKNYLNITRKTDIVYWMWLTNTKSTVYEKHELNRER